MGTPIRRQKASHLNSQVLRLLVNGTPISKISEIAGLSPRDVYNKIDFIYIQVQKLTAAREPRTVDLDWSAVGRRFSSDSQTLKLNWPNKKTRAQIAVHHLCTAHSNTGYIMAAHLQLDPEVDLDCVEAAMLNSGDFHLPRSFRQQGRLWARTEFKAYLDSITRKIVPSKLVAPEVALDLQLPHSGALVRQDIQQLAHALVVRRMLGRSDVRFTFVLDGDPGLALAFTAAFVPWIKRERADIVLVEFDKEQTNDSRNSLVADGKAALAIRSGKTISELELSQGRR